MTIRKYLVGCCFGITFFISGASMAQNDVKKSELLFKFLPLNIFNPNMPHLTFGLEFKIKNKISLEIDYGRRIFNQGIYPYLNYHLFGRSENNLYYDSIVTPSSGERIHFEIKYYFLTSKGSDMYAGLAFYKINDTRNKKITYFVPDPLDPNVRKGTIEHTAIKKELHIIDFIVGLVSKFNRVRLESYLMIGLKHKKQEYIKNEFDKLGYSSLHHYVWDMPMNSFRPSVNVGFRISYQIF
jgi:hypothetical protein